MNTFGTTEVYLTCSCGAIILAYSKLAAEHELTLHRQTHRFCELTRGEGWVSSQVNEAMVRCLRYESRERALAYRADQWLRIQQAPMVVQ